MGQVAKPRLVQASMYVMAKSIVFFTLHVSALTRDGSNSFRRVTTLTKENASRTKKENGARMIRGRGYPLENNKMRVFNLRSAHLLVVFWEGF
mmetsp:Transcript_47973/g.58091  ORF Transcript_47973/g.58091 Transcript_47973/m.58091 type:complete len:93 (-) Transcript_47973:448-726(-)